MISRTHLLLLSFIPLALFNLLPQFKQIDCLQTSASQQHQRQGSDISVNNNSSSSNDDVTASLLLPTNLSDNNSESSSNSSRDLTLLSSEEYVDAKEVPAILIDRVSDEAPAEAADNESALLAPTDEPKLDHSSQPKAIPQEPTSGSSSSNNSASSTPAPTTTAATIVTTKAPEIRATLTTTIVPASNGNESTSRGGDGSDKDNKDGGSHEEEDADQGGDDEANSDTTKETSQSDNYDNSNRNNLTFEPPQNISQYMDYIERLFHDLRHQITDLFEPHIPKLIRTSQMVELSNSCSYDMLRMALALRQFEPWALRMIDSSGKMPEGIFEGSFTALGAYDECINIVFESASSQHATSNSAPSPVPSVSTGDNNQQPADGKHVPPPPPPTQGKYCLVTVSPFMPPKPPADKVERMFQDEANRRNYTKVSHSDDWISLVPMSRALSGRLTAR